MARGHVSLAQVDDEEVRGRTEDEKEIFVLDQRIASAERKVSALEDRYGLDTLVKSPYAGRVVELKVNVGELVERGTPLITLVRSAPGDAATPSSTQQVLSAVVYVPPSFGKQVRVGERAHVALSTARREEFGFIIGRVRSVADVPSTAEGMQRVLKNRQLVQSLSNNAAPFEVIIDLETDAKTPSGYRWSSSSGPDLKINGGTLVGADIEVRTIPLLAFAIPQARQLLEAFRPSSGSEARP